ncbi:YdiY family protein [Candidatus Omnitrophota bacterium]
MSKCRILINTVLVALFVVLFTQSFLYADEVILKNQDKITGRIVQDDNSVVVIETEAMGMVSVKKDFVEMIKAPGEQVVVEEPAAAVEEPKLWQRDVAVSYSRTSGNTEKAQSSLSGNFVRKTDDNEFIIKGESHYSSTDKKMDSQKWNAMTRYASSFWEKKWYHFYKLEVDHDRFANINYRLIPSTGLGYWFSDTDEWKAMTEGALGLEHTDFRDSTKDSDEAVFIGRGYLEKKIFRDSRFIEDAYIYPSLSETGDYRLHSETSLVNPISDSLSLKLSLTLDYDSNPPTDTKKTDTRFTTSLQYSF